MPEAANPQAERERLRAIAATHAWVGAATIPLSPSQARTSDLRAALTIKANTRVQIIDAYCGACKNTWESVVGIECPAKDSRANEHLRGGPIGERKKRGRQVRHAVVERAS